MWPSALLILSNSSVDPFWVVINTASPQIAGVLSPEPGKGHFQAIPLSSRQKSGRPVSLLVLFCRGPRQLGQFSAWQVISHAEVTSIHVAPVAHLAGRFIVRFPA